MKKHKTKHPLTPLEAEPLADLLSRLGIDDWDFVVLGDGSGSNWGRACAWASVSIERVTAERLVWWGFSNRGTVNVSEGMAPLWPLLWLADRESKRVVDGLRRRSLAVHVITDSKYVQGRGASENALFSRNAILFDSFKSLTRQGIVLHWHWLGRNSTGLHQYTDRLSKLVRKCCQAYNVQESLSTSDGEIVKTVYEVNPG